MPSAIAHRGGRGKGGMVALVPGVLYVIVALAAIFALLRPAFLSAGNIANIGTQSATLLIISMPMTMIVLTEGIDISMGAVLSLAGVVLAMVLLAGHSVFLGLLAAVGVGVAFGLFNGLCVSYLRLPSFVVTLGSFGMAEGVAEIVTDGNVIVGFGPSLGHFYGQAVLGVPMPIVVAGLAYIVAHILLYHTRFGTYVFAVGGNREALALAGVPVGAYHAAIYAVGGVFVGVAALMLTGRINSGPPTVAIGMEFDAVAAVILGGTSFERGEGWIFGTLLGVIAVGMLRNGLDLLAVPSSLQSVSIGLLVIVTLLLDRFGTARA